MHLFFSLQKWRPVILAIGILVFFMLILLAMGRIPVCACGIGFWTWNAWSSATSQHFGDPYSFSHIIHGILFYWLLRGLFPQQSRAFFWLGAMLLEVGWEILENSPIVITRYRDVTASLDYTGDSVLNSVGDVLFTLLGVGIAEKFRWKVALAFFIVIELIMLVTIRDNFTLNVLMLLFPISAIQEWQTAPRSQ